MIPKELAPVHIPIDYTSPSYKKFRNSFIEYFDKKIEELYVIKSHYEGLSKAFLEFGEIFQIVQKAECLGIYPYGNFVLETLS